MGSRDLDPEADVKRWLDRLRDGTPEQKAAARTELGLIFERRGQISEATELYWANVVANVSDRRPYERLAAICRSRGDAASEARVLNAMDLAAASGSSEARQTNPFAPRVSRKAVLVAVSLVVVVSAVLAMVLADLRGATGAPPPLSLLSVPSWCYDAALRFPKAGQPQVAIQDALLERGINPYRNNPFVKNYMENAPRIVGGWAARSLHDAHEGRPTMTLAQWLEGGNTLAYFLPRDKWAELRSLSATSCEGAFLKNPRNSGVVRLIESSSHDSDASGGTRPEEQERLVHQPSVMPTVHGRWPVSRMPTTVPPGHRANPGVCSIRTPPTMDRLYPSRQGCKCKVRTPAAAALIQFSPGTKVFTQCPAAGSSPECTLRGVSSGSTV